MPPSGGFGGQSPPGGLNYSANRIKGMVTSGGALLDPSKAISFITFGSLWVHDALGNMLTSIVSNPHFGKRPGTRHMTSCSSHFLPHVTNNVFSYL